MSVPSLSLVSSMFSSILFSSFNFWFELFAAEFLLLDMHLTFNKGLCVKLSYLAYAHREVIDVNKNEY
jgi:hypothetical protein